MATAKKKTSTAKAKKASASSAPKSSSASVKKKTVTNKTAGSNNNSFSKKDLDNYRSLLLELRRELIGDVDQMRGEALDSNRKEKGGELSSMPVHMADIGTDNYEHEFTLGLIESERKVLTDIDHALSKFEKGSYGICEGTGKRIAKARLKAKPYARYCIDYARKIEKGLVVPNVNGNLTDEAV